MRNPIKASRALEFQAAHEVVVGKSDDRRSKFVPKRPRLIAYVPDTTITAPQVGDTVTICHRSTADARGSARVQRSDTTNRRVKAVYMSDTEGFTIKDNAGDVWLVRPASIGGTQWESFVKGDKQKVVSK